MYEDDGDNPSLNIVYILYRCHYPKGGAGEKRLKK